MDEAGNEEAFVAENQPASDEREADEGADEGAGDIAQCTVAGLAAWLLKELLTGRRFEKLREFSRGAESFDHFHLYVSAVARGTLPRACSEPDDRHHHDERAADGDNWNPKDFVHCFPPSVLPHLIRGRGRSG